ncbi:hypothetical protein MMC10_009454 [Thelotrema lepadinum]|nr:hypothetical protein [Thelotrema lepadinum]
MSIFRTSSHIRLGEREVSIRTIFIDVLDTNLIQLAASEEVTTWMGEGVDEAEIEDPELYGSAEDVEDEVEEEVTPTELGSDEFGQCDTESEESDADGGNDSGTEGKEDSGEDSEEDGEKGDSEGEESKHSQRPSSTLRELQQKGGSPTHTKWNSQRKQPDAMQQDGQALFTRKRPTSKQPEVEAINRTRDIGARQRAEDSSNPHKRKSSFKRVIKKLIQSITGRNNQPRLENSHDSYAYCSKRKQPMDTERSHVDHRSSRKYRDPSKLGHGKSNAEEYNFSQRCARQPAMSARRDGNNNTHDPKHWSEDDDLIGSKAPYLGDRYRLPQNQSQAKLKTKQQPQPKTKGGKMATKITTFKASRKPSGSANQEMSQPGSCFSANGQSRSFSNAPVQKASRIPRLQRKAA